MAKPHRSNDKRKALRSDLDDTKRTKKTRETADAPETVAAQATETDGVRKSKTALDVLRTLCTSGDGKAMFDAAPTLGADSLEALSRRTWGLLADHAVSVRRTALLLQDHASKLDRRLRQEATENPDAKPNAALEEQLAGIHGRIARTLDHGTGTEKEIVGVLLNINKAYINAEFEKAWQEMKIVTDRWRTGMKTTNPPPPPPMDDDEEEPDEPPPRELH